MAPAPPHVHVGSGKVTDSQVAFMVECYLRDSRFTRTLEEFRSEAARILHPLRAVPKGARSLSAVLNDYVALKEEQLSAAAEKVRVEDLFHGLQEILSVYLSGVSKNAASVGEGGKEGVPIAISPPSSAGTLQSPLHVPFESEAAALPGNQHSKEKVSTHKRKTQGKSCGESLQEGNPSVDLAKKPRRASNVKQSYLNPASVAGTMGTDSPMASKAVQPRTPPMSSISSKLQQQQQSFLCDTFSESPVPSPLPTEATQSPVSPNRTSNSPPPPPTARDSGGQHHQDPQTPPSFTKSSPVTNRSTCPLNPIEENLNPTTAPGNPSNVQQLWKGPLLHLSSATSHYALRAHKKPSNTSCVPLSDARSNCNLRITRKKSSNSKCRLLDFSAAAGISAPEVLPPKQGNRVRISSRNCVATVSLDPQDTVESSADCTTASECECVPLMHPSSAISHGSQMTEVPLQCDTFSFDELFDLDLDTSLISELEDLAPFTGMVTEPLPGSKSSDTAAFSCTPDPFTRGILTEIKNLFHPDEAPVPELQTVCPSAKQRKLATSAAGNDMATEDKENLHAVVMCNSPH